MWILNKAVIDLFLRVGELLCKLLLKDSCVHFVRRQPAPRSAASCSYFKWAVSTTFKWNLRPPTSLPLKFLLLSASPFSFSCSFHTQKERLFVIDYTSAHISFSCLRALRLLFFILLLFFLLYFTHIQLSKNKETTHSCSLVHAL